MTSHPLCSKCASPYVYEDGELLICPECSYEFSKTPYEIIQEIRKVCDANGVELKDGDSVSVIKDLKIKGSSSIVKVGTKVKNIRIIDSDHDIDCKIPGIGQMGLKSEFVKKISE